MSVGGRFNVGEDINNHNIAKFHALYIADSYETAMSEKFMLPESDKCDGLDRQDFALASESSFTSVKLEGVINNVFDLSDESCTSGFIKLISKFTIPKDIQLLARKAKIKPWTVVQNKRAFLSMCLEQNWRTLPMLFDVPSNPQIMGSFIRQMNYAGIKYPSSKADGENLVIFPENLDDTSHIQVIGCPKEVKHSLLNSQNYQDFLS